MSLSRILCTSLQAIASHAAFTPPNKTPAQGRYHQDQVWLLRVATPLFVAIPLLVYLWTLLEGLSILSLPYLPLPFQSALCSTPQHNIRLTPLSFIGTLAVALGAYIRLDCFRTLGSMFTFDLTVHPEHKLVTRRFYSYVRHPAYTGSILIIIGTSLTHFTPGSWLTECGTFNSSSPPLYLVWAAWWAWTLSVGVSRAMAEDQQMKKLFKSEWEAYADSVHWWFFPGLL